MLNVAAARRALLLFALCISTGANSQENDKPSFAYLLHCSGCHIEDGRGDPPMIPDLREDLGVLLDSPAGRSYMLRVPGVADTPIPAQQMAELMNWMIGTLLYPERTDFVPYTADEVIEGRRNKLNDPLRYRREQFSHLFGDSADAALQ